MYAPTILGGDRVAITLNGSHHHASIALEIVAEGFEVIYGDTVIGSADGILRERKRAERSIVIMREVPAEVLIGTDVDPVTVSGNRRSEGIIIDPEIPELYTASILYIARPVLQLANIYPGTFRFNGIMADLKIFHRDIGVTGDGSAKWRHC